MESQRWFPKPWMLPLLVVALLVPPVLGFALGGVAIGFLVGGLTAGVLIFIAARSRPTEPIAPGPPAAGEPVLAVAIAAIDDRVTAERVAAVAAGAGEGAPRSVLVLAPLEPSATERWLSLRGTTRIDAQRKLDRAVELLEAAGSTAAGEIVDADPAQAVDDQAAVHGAAAIAFVVPRGECGDEIAEIRARTERPVELIEVGADGAAG